MARLLLALLAVVLVLLSVAMRQDALAQVIGIAVGTLWLLSGVARGGALGSVRRFGAAPADTDARLGALLAALGVVAGALGRQPPWPLPLRVLCGVCLLALAALALFLAGRARR